MEEMTTEEFRQKLDELRRAVRRVALDTSGVSEGDRSGGLDRGGPESNRRSEDAGRA
jgi:hypothetical protein